MVRIVAIIPARNESGVIGAAVAGLIAQQRPPDRIIVIANNCTDDGATVQAAITAGAEVMNLGMVPGKKAGALNVGMAAVLPGLFGADYVFVQDADTIAVPAFLSTALACARDEDRYRVVSGRYACKAEYGLIGLLQRAEFTREGRRLDRRGDRTHIVVGTSCLFPVHILRAVIHARTAGLLPGGGNCVYDSGSLTEDFELSLALKTLGYHTVSPHACDAITDVMATIPMLWAQRIRWMRGGIENLRTYGWTKVTRPFWLRQGFILFGIASFLTFVTSLAMTLIITHNFEFSVLWVPIMVIFLLDRVIVVRRAGPMTMFVAATLVIEMGYDLFQQVVYCTAAVKAFRHTPGEWKET